MAQLQLWCLKSGVNQKMSYVVALVMVMFHVQAAVYTTEYSKYIGMRCLDQT